MENLTAINVLSALAQPTRLAVFTLLAQARDDGLTSGELAQRTRAAASTMSSHLTILSHAGLVTAAKAGKNVVYRAVPDKARQLAAFLYECSGPVTETASAVD